MIPSRTWFPASLPDRAAWMANFAVQFADVALSLGFTAGDVTAVQADNENFQSIAATQTTLDNFTASIRQYRISLTEDDAGAPLPVFPTAVFAAVPNPTRPAGMFERIDNIVKRIRVAPAYNDETGAMLGIIPAKGDDLVISELKPKLKASTQPGSIVQLDFVRGKTDGIAVEYQIDGGPAWNNAGKFFKSPAEINIPNGTAPTHSVRLRARYVVGNDIVGQNSDEVTVATQS